ncbi:MAG: ABC1 kinase family protein, partial [Gammaproteobacteria bacterium]
MQRITQWIRLWQIQRAILRHNLVEIILPRQAWLSPIVILSKMNPWSWKRDKSLSRGENLRLALQELGPFFIKFGQLLATRRDLLPDDIADELSKLQDQVVPFTEPDPRTVVSHALGFSLQEVLFDFNPQPLASASIAQVHTATLADGREVVVKVLRPGIEKIISRDVYLLKNLARKSTRFFAQGARLMA